MTEIYLGPPGTGKTTKLIGLVQEELARGVPPDKIGYVSFTRRAAQEAVERATKKFKLDKKDFPHFSTLHALCYRQLSMKRGDVLEGARLQAFADYAGVRVTGRFSEDGTLTGFDLGDRILFMENLARVRGVDLRTAYDLDDDQLPWSEVSRVSRCLAAFKAANGLHDFTDMLTEFLKSGIRLGLRSLFVDESQDLSHLQWLVVESLARDCERVVVAGDDDQAIYKWAGADVDHLIDLRGDVRVLGQSWRVPPVMQRIANDVIRHVGRRREKEWKPRAGGDGQLLRAMRFDQVDVSDPQRKDSADQPVLVLARNAYVLREQVEPELRRQGVIYERHGRSSISSSLMEVVQTWERLRRGERVEVSAVRDVFEWMTVGRGFARGHKKLPGEPDDRLISKEELLKRGALLTEAPWHEAIDRLPRDEVGYVRAARARGERLSRRPRVVLSTIHGAKGGQADHVVLMKEMAGRTHREMRLAPEDEARVWYVGVTRAMHKLTIVESQTANRCPWI